MSISDTSELIDGSLLKASTESLSSSLVYFISGPYSYSIRRQCSTISVVKFSNVRFLWSSYTVIRCPKRILWKSFKVATVLNSSFSDIVEFICAGVDLRK